METTPRRGIGLRFAFWTFLVSLAWSSHILHAQNTYTSTPGKTSIYSDYDPYAPARKTPVTSSAASFTKPFRPTVPIDRYLAQKAEIAKYSQSTFAFPAQMEVSSPGLAPRATTTPGPIASTPTFSWQGLQDTRLQPPSPDIAVGPNDVIQVVNSTIAQFTKSGTLVKSNSFQDWFNDVLSASCPTNCLLFDPWIVYDQLHGRFVFLISAAPSNFTYSFLLISVSKGPTFGGGWKNFAMNISLEGTVQTQFFGDSWRLGFDNQAVYLSGNMFNAAGLFQYAKIRVLKKTDLYNPATMTLPFQDFGSSAVKLKNADGTLADSLVPLHQRGQPGAVSVGFFVSATTFLNQGASASFLTIWRIADPLASPLTLLQGNIGGLMPYTTPAVASQLASSVTLDSGDTRMLKVIYRNGFLYTARNTGYTDVPNAATTVTFDVINTSTAKITSQARLLNANSFYPAFDVPATVNIGTQFATANLVTGTTTAPNGTLTYPGLSNNLKAGESPFSLSNCNPCRWGDYFGGAVDPISGGLWVSGEYAKPPLTGGIGQWGTWVGYYPWLTTQTFNDVPPSSPYFDFINVLNSWQITTGCSTTAPMFCPGDMVTRDQFATFIIRSMLGNTFSYSQTPHFTDVPSSSPFFPYIQKFADLGLTHGCTPTTYCPSGNVPRMDAAVLLVRGKLESLFGDNFTYPTTPFFTDVPSNLPQFPYIQKMYELGLTTGCTATTFCPNNNLTRQEVATFMIRAFLN